MKGNPMKRYFMRATAALLLVCACLTAFAACKKTDDGSGTTAGGTTTAPGTAVAGSVDLSGFTVVYPGFGGAAVSAAANRLAKALGCEAKADKGASGDYPDAGGSEILVGVTDRAESTAAKEALDASKSKKKHFYSITVSEKRIAIVGNTPVATVEAVNVMIEDLINDKTLNIPVGTVKSGSIAADPIKASKAELVPEVISTIAKAPIQTWGNGVGYPSVIELAHNGDKNGMLLAAYSVSDSGKTGGPTSIRVARSTDGGGKWLQCGRAYEEFDKSIEACWNPHLFELPTKMGELSEGTIILSAISIDAGQKIKSAVCAWVSTDQGKSWKEYSVVDTAGGLSEGMYEPYIMYENGKLYCFYSDESEHDVHSQKLVYKTSTDGKNWSEKFDMVTLDDRTERPGMAVVAKMGNGKYFGVYEVCSTLPDKGATIYFKIVDSIDDWRSGEKGEVLKTKDGQTCGSAPWCAWTPVGGDCGMLIVSAKYGAKNNEFFVSFDYGETFELVKNPLEYSGRNGLGYSASLFFSADGKTLYYANTIDDESNEEKAKIDFARIRIR